MKFKLKKYYIVMGVKYKVKLADLNNRGLLGECNWDKKEILISNDIKTQKLLKKTILHEIQHAILYESGLADVISCEINELICLNSERLVDILG